MNEATSSLGPAPGSHVRPGVAMANSQSLPIAVAILLESVDFAEVVTDKRADSGDSCWPNRQAQPTRQPSNAYRESACIATDSRPLSKGSVQVDRKITFT